MIRSAGHRERNGLPSRPPRSNYDGKNSPNGPASHLNLRIACHIRTGPAAAGGLANSFLPRDVASLLGRHWITSRILRHTSIQKIKLKMDPVCILQDEPAKHCLFHICIFSRCDVRLTFNFKQAQEYIRLGGGSWQTNSYSPARILLGGRQGGFPCTGMKSMHCHSGPLCLSILLKEGELSRLSHI